MLTASSWCSTSPVFFFLPVVFCLFCFVFAFKENIYTKTEARRCVRQQHVVCLLSCVAVGASSVAVKYSARTRYSVWSDCCSDIVMSCLLLVGCLAGWLIGWLIAILVDWLG